MPLPPPPLSRLLSLLTILPSSRCLGFVRLSSLVTSNNLRSVAPRTRTIHNNNSRRQSNSPIRARPLDIELAAVEDDATMASRSRTYAAFAASLLADVVESSDPSAERAVDVLSAMKEESDDGPVTTAILEGTKIGKVLTKAAKACKRHRRTSDERDRWDAATALAEALLREYKDAADAEAKAGASERRAADATASRKVGLPESTAAYRTRLVAQKKDMYKDPPAAPPAHVAIEDSRTAKPKRNKATGELTFACGEDESIKALVKDFRPNRTPEEVLRAGSFGGTYFRPIVSAVTNVKYDSASVLKDTVDPGWISELTKSSMLTSSTYHPSVNKFGVKCGGSLGMWESSGWISDADPYGWFQWYCRFYSGRRCSDDARQISRWCKSAGPRGRFRSQLCNKILAAGTTAGDTKISPVIRQTLLHWGLEITEEVLEKHKRR